MFVAVACEFASDDHRQAAAGLLAQYGFSRVQKDTFESPAITEVALGRLKRELDRVTDSYDKLRLYQYPVDDTLAVTVLSEKKWRRLVLTR